MSFRLVVLLEDDTLGDADDPQGAVPVFALVFLGVDVADEQVDAAFDGPAGKRFFAVVLLPRKQAFMHEVGGSTNDITRVDTTLPSSTAEWRDNVP